MGNVALIVDAVLLLSVSLLGIIDLLETSDRPVASALPRAPVVLQTIVQPRLVKLLRLMAL